jgi:threonine dehydrogenase-like Zn-dependent dehydrogenase
VNGRAAKGEDFPASIDLAARGAIKLDPLITHVIPVAELGTAMEMLTSDADRRMKIILEN